MFAPDEYWNLVGEKKNTAFKSMIEQSETRHMNISNKHFLQKIGTIAVHPHSNV